MIERDDKLVTIKEASEWASGYNVIFSITEEDLQDEAMERIGRILDWDEMRTAKKWIEEGLGGLALDVTYNTIFTEMIK